MNNVIFFLKPCGAYFSMCVSLMCLLLLSKYFKMMMIMLSVAFVERVLPEFLWSAPTLCSSQLIHISQNHEFRSHLDEFCLLLQKLLIGRQSGSLHCLPMRQQRWCLLSLPVQQRHELRGFEAVTLALTLQYKYGQSTFLQSVHLSGWGEH